MEEITANVNWMAVFVGAVLAYGLGWLWYSPMGFGKKWAEGVGTELAGTWGMPAGALVGQAIGTFLLAWVVGVTAANNALMTFVLIIVTFAILVFCSGLFAKNSLYANCTNAGFIVAMAVVMFVAQAVL